MIKHMEDRLFYLATNLLQASAKESKKEAIQALVDTVRTNIARGTGRTTRMVNEAKVLAEQGKKVIIIVLDDTEKSRVESCLPVNSTVVVTTDQSRINWTAARVIGHHETEVFIDHAVIENRYAKLLSMLHRWDAPQPTRQELIAQYLAEEAKAPKMTVADSVGFATNRNKHTVESNIPNARKLFFDVINIINTTRRCNIQPSEKHVEEGEKLLSEIIGKGITISKTGIWRLACCPDQKRMVESRSYGDFQDLLTALYNNS